jgi:hypothetical protein
MPWRCCQLSNATINKRSRLSLIGQTMPLRVSPSQLIGFEPAGPSTSVAGENLIAFDLDRLFRSERRTDVDLDYPRAEAAASCSPRPATAACSRRTALI